MRLIDNSEKITVVWEVNWLSNIKLGVCSPTSINILKQNEKTSMEKSNIWCLMSPNHSNMLLIFVATIPITSKVLWLSSEVAVSMIPFERVILSVNDCACAKLANRKDDEIVVNGMDIFLKKFRMGFWMLWNPRTLMWLRSKLRRQLVLRLKLALILW